MAIFHSYVKLPEGNIGFAIVPRWNEKKCRNLGRSGKKQPSFRVEKVFPFKPWPVDYCSLMVASHVALPLDLHREHVRSSFSCWRSLDQITFHDMNHHVWPVKCIFEGFLKWGYPQIIYIQYFKMAFSIIKQPALGIPYKVVPHS